MGPVFQYGDGVPIGHSDQLHKDDLIGIGKGRVWVWVAMTMKMRVINSRAAVGMVGHYQGRSENSQVGEQIDNSIMDGSRRGSLKF